MNVKISMSEAQSAVILRLPSGKALLFPVDGGNAKTAALLASASVQAMITPEQVEALAALLDGACRIIGFVGAFDVPAEVPPHLVRASPSACPLSVMTSLGGVSEEGLKWTLDALGGCGLVHVVDRGEDGRGVVPTMPASWPTGVRARHRQRIAGLVHEGKWLRICNK